MDELVPDKTANPLQTSAQPDANQDLSQQDIEAPKNTAFAELNDQNSLSTPASPAEQTKPAPESIYPTPTEDPMTIIASETTSSPEEKNLSDNNSNPAPAPQIVNPVPPVPEAQAQPQPEVNNATFAQKNIDNFSAEQSKKSRWPWIVGGVIVAIVLIIAVLYFLGFSVSLQS